MMMERRLFSILLCCIYSFTKFSYVYGTNLRKFEIFQNVRLNNQPNLTFSNCESDVKCLTRCNAESFCAYAQYSTQGRVCCLFSKHACGSLEVHASQLNMYKKAPVDITDNLVLNGAELIPPAGVTLNDAYYTIDGDISTEASYDFGTAWIMEFDGAWSIAKVAVTYFRPYNLNLTVSMSGTQLEIGQCTWVPRLYFVIVCEYLPASACGTNVTSISITPVMTSMGPIGVDIKEVKIYS